jgi:hypothetical protein
MIIKTKNIGWTQQQNGGDKEWTSKLEDRAIEIS